MEKFYIFFNPWFSLFQKKIGDTEYGLGWLPLGGYVKISGMIDESMDKEQMKKPPQPWEFRSKPAYQRLLIMVGGVLVNFVLALVIYSTTLYVWGDQYLPTKNVKYGIMCDSVALDIGLRNGDKILSVDNVEVEKFNKIFHDIVVNSARSVQVEREGRIVDIPIGEEHLAPLLKSEVFIATRIPFIVDDFSKESPAQAAGLLRTVGACAVCYRAEVKGHSQDQRSRYRNRRLAGFSDGRTSHARGDANVRYSHRLSFGRLQARPYR